MAKFLLKIIISSYLLICRWKITNYRRIMKTPKNYYDDIPVDTWLFMNSPLQLLSIIVLYIFFVLKLGPQLMEKRAPFQLKKVLMLYNAYQVVFNAWLFSKLFLYESTIEALIQCDYTTLPKGIIEGITASGWWYLFSKIVDLLDTVFFVLRKKNSQVTFLHLYHHTITVVSTWIAIKYFPDGQGMLIITINSFVHIVMYSYYLMAVVTPPKYLWWKKYITWLQLVQFFIAIPVLTYLEMMDCNISRGLLCFYAFNILFFIYLFTDFYMKAYKNETGITLKVDVKVK